MNEQQIKEVLSDQEYVKSLLEMENPEDVQKSLEDKGIEMSIEELKQVAEIIKKRTSGELADEDLENVAGGSITAAGVACVFAGITCACTVYNTVNNVMRDNGWRW